MEGLIIVVVVVVHFLGGGLFRLVLGILLSRHITNKGIIYLGNGLNLVCLLRWSFLSPFLCETVPTCIKPKKIGLVELFHCHQTPRMLVYLFENKCILLIRIHYHMLLFNHIALIFVSFVFGAHLVPLLTTCYQVIQLLSVQRPRSH